MLEQETEVEVKLELGELQYLSKSLSQLDDHEKEDDIKKTAPSMSVEQSYGNPLTPEEAIQAVPSGDDGLIRYSIVVPDLYCINGKLLNGLNKRDFDAETMAIKPRRPSLLLTKRNLMSSLTMVDTERGPRYIFNGILNGWPSLRHFELIGLKKRRALPGGVQAPEFIMNSVKQAWVHHWRADVEGKDGIPPEIPDHDKIYRATLRGAPWTSLGWSPTSPGFVFWYEAQRSQGPRVLYGSNLVTELEHDICKTVRTIFIHQMYFSTTV